MSTVTPPPPLMKIKKEGVTEEIKEYAESAMNELLGWYGYSNNNEHSNNQQSSFMTYHKLSAMHATKMPKHAISQTSSLAATNLTSNGHRSSHKSSSTFDDFEANIDSRSSTDDSMNTSPNIITMATMQSNSTPSDKPHSEDCGWCKRSIPTGGPEFLTTPEGLKYCTESCFTQSRRASYKRAKTCDWCKHIRHAVSYVDFQDGASQLQFCSEKCLNQYKMQIFCKETQAQLDLNPDLRGKGRSTENELITPDLWMKNCRSRSMSPDERSTESDGTSHASEQPLPMPIKNSAIKISSEYEMMASDRKKVDSVIRHAQTAQEEDEPSGNAMPFNYQVRLLRKRRIQRQPHSIACDMIKGANNNDGQNENRNIIGVRRLLRSSNDKFNEPNTSPNTVAVASILDDSSNSAIKIQSLQNTLRNSRFVGDAYPHHTMPARSTTMTETQTANLPTMPPLQNKPTFECDAETATEWTPPQTKQSATYSTNFLANMFNTQLPSATVLVPYPIIFPLPLPIPIPLPYEVFLRTVQSNRTSEMHQRNENIVTNIETMHCKNAHLNDQPLDFSKQSANIIESPRHCEYDDTRDVVEQIK